MSQLRSTSNAVGADESLIAAGRARPARPADDLAITLILYEHSDETGIQIGDPLFASTNLSSPTTPSPPAPAPAVGQPIGTWLGWLPASYFASRQTTLGCWLDETLSRSNFSHSFTPSSTNIPLHASLSEAIQAAHLLPAQIHSEEEALTLPAPELQVIALTITPAQSYSETMRDMAVSDTDAAVLPIANTARHLFGSRHLTLHCVLRHAEGERDENWNR